MNHEQMLAKMRREYSKTASVAEEHGWKIDHLADSSESPYLLIRVNRGGEQISIWWRDAKLTEAPVYSYAGVETKLRNHSAMLQQMACRPDPVRIKRKAKKAASRTSGVDLLDIIKALPWDPDELDDRELKRACYGRTLVWLNSISGMPEQDMVRADPDNPASGPNWNANVYRVTRSRSGRRAISFVGMFGYRSVGTDALLQVM